MNNLFQITDLLARALKVCLATFCCAATVASALAQTNGQFPVSTNVIEPTPTPQTSPLLVPETLFPSPTPAPLVSPTPAPTPLPECYNASTLTSDANSGASGRQNAFRGAQLTHSRAQPVLVAAHQTPRMVILASNRSVVAESGPDPLSYAHPPRNPINRGDVERVD